MGCDGGTIPRRDELVRLKKKPEQVIFCFLILSTLLYGFDPDKKWNGKIHFMD